jgi:hypothetical protein
LFWLWVVCQLKVWPAFSGKLANAGAEEGFEVLSGVGVFMWLIVVEILGGRWDRV